MLPPSTDSSTSPLAPGADDASEPGPLPPPGRYRRLSRRARLAIWSSVVGLGLLVSGVIAAAVVQVPYWSLSPGAIRDTAAVISVDGVETYPFEGSIAFTTVSNNGRLSVLQLAVAWFDPDATIIHEDEFLVGTDREQNRQINLQLMDMSTQNASYVALSRLGYDVATVGTGAMVIRVEEGSAAEGVLEVGDTIVEVDGSAIELAEELVEAIGGLPPGTEVAMAVQPLDGSDIDERTVVLGAREDDPARGFLGVSPTTRDLAFEFPFQIRFATGGVGGPSAGLAYTLALLDMLTPGDLTGGLDLAITGTIDRDGNIGPIGGLEFKTIAARNDGYDLFIVPASSTPEDLELAYERAGDRLEIVEVSHLDEVLDLLEERGGTPLPTG